MMKVGKIISNKIVLKVTLILIVVLSLTPVLRVFADQSVEVPIATTDFVGTTYNDPKTFTVDVSNIKNAKQIFIEVTVSTTDDKYLRLITIEIDNVVVNEKLFRDGTKKYTAMISPASPNTLRYDVTNLVKGKDSVVVKIYVWHLSAGPYTWSVSAKFIGIISEDVVIPDPTNTSNSFAIPVYVASGGIGIALLGVAYVLKQRED
jgi:hypothetical protein